MSGSARLVAVVEDDEALRSAVRALLESWGYRTAGYPDAEALLGTGEAAEAACLLVDCRLPGIDGIELVAELRRRQVLTPVVMMSGHGNISMAVDALRAGAQDFIEKPFEDEPLVERIERALVESPSLLPHGEAAVLIERLTPRETEVMREVVAGRPNKVIAHNLGIGLKTVEMHRARVMKKTGSKTLAHLVRLAAAAGVRPGNLR